MGVRRLHHSPCVDRLKKVPPTGSALLSCAASAVLRICAIAAKFRFCSLRIGSSERRIASHYFLQPLAASPTYPRRTSSSSRQKLTFFLAAGTRISLGLDNPTQLYGRRQSVSPCRLLCRNPQFGGFSDATSASQDFLET